MTIWHKTEFGSRDPNTTTYLRVSIIYAFESRLRTGLIWHERFTLNSTYIHWNFCVWGLHLFPNHILYNFALYYFILFLHWWGILSAITLRVLAIMDFCTGDWQHQCVNSKNEKARDIMSVCDWTYYNELALLSTNHLLANTSQVGQLGQCWPVMTQPWTSVGVMPCVCRVLPRQASSWGLIDLLHPTA